MPIGETTLLHNLHSPWLPQTMLNAQTVLLVTWAPGRVLNVGAMLIVLPYVRFVGPMASATAATLRSATCVPMAVLSSRWDLWSMRE